MARKKIKPRGCAKAIKDQFDQTPRRIAKAAAQGDKSAISLTTKIRTEAKADGDDGMEVRKTEEGNATRCRELASWLPKPDYDVSPL